MLGYLFIYGTLHPDRAPDEIAEAARRLQPFGPAALRGRVYNLGDYPGLVLDPAGGLVQGEVFILPDEPTLAQLDAYEDFRPDDREGSLFLRTSATVTMQDGSQLLCWVYVYNAHACSTGVAAKK